MTAESTNKHISGESGFWTGWCGKTLGSLLFYFFDCPIHWRGGFFAINGLRWQMSFHSFPKVLSSPREWRGNPKVNLMIVPQLWQTWARSWLEVLITPSRVKGLSTRRVPPCQNTCPVSGAVYQSSYRLGEWMNSSWRVNFLISSLSFIYHS